MQFDLLIPRGNPVQKFSSGYDINTISLSSNLLQPHNYETKRTIGKHFLNVGKHFKTKFLGFRLRHVKWVKEFKNIIFNYKNMQSIVNIQCFISYYDKTIFLFWSLNRKIKSTRFGNTVIKLCNSISWSLEGTQFKNLVQERHKHN